MISFQLIDDLAFISRQHLPDEQTITVAISGSFPSTMSSEGETVSPGGDIVIEMLLQCMEKSVMCETTVPGKNPPGKPPSKEKR